MVAASLIELKVKGSEKLGYGSTSLEQLRLVLESDGTEIEDDTYFQTSDKDTVFLLLKKGEKWLPPGVEALKAGTVKTYHFHLDLLINQRQFCSQLSLPYLESFVMH